MHLACIGFAMLFVWWRKLFRRGRERQMVRFGVGMVVMLAIALTDIRLWLRYAYLFLRRRIDFTSRAVEFVGAVGMGEQRWIGLEFFYLQPSELMKIALVLSLARFFHRLSLDDVAHPIRAVLGPIGRGAGRPRASTTGSRHRDSAVVRQYGHVLPRRCAHLEVCTCRSCRPGVGTGCLVDAAPIRRSAL